MMLVLVVDDDKTMRILLRSYLEKASFHILEASSAEEALQACHKQMPDLILLDIILPGMTGMDLLKALKLDEALRDLPVIMMTSLDADENLALAFERGAFDFVRKPVRQMELIARVRSALRLKREIEQRTRNADALFELTRLLGEENQALQNQLRVDSLTGLATRRELDDTLARLWNGGQDPLSVLMVDVDHFKEYNDSYGHLVGDDCLRRVGNAINSCLSSPDQLAARYGGEEFALLLPGFDRAQASDFAERLRSSVAAIGLEHRASPAGSVSISCGVACRLPGDLAPRSLLERADQGLYVAKRTGRNRVVALSATSEA